MILFYHYNNIYRFPPRRKHVRRRRGAGVIHNGHHREIDGIDLNAPRTYYISYYIIMYVYIYNNKYYIVYAVRGLRCYIYIYNIFIRA